MAKDIKSKTRRKLQVWNSVCRSSGTTTATEEADDMTSSFRTNAITSDVNRTSVQQSLLKREEDGKPCISSLIRRESQAISRAISLVVILLFIAAIIFSLAVYFHVRKDEVDEFEKQYYANSDRIVESFHDSVERKLAAISVMATTITSYARDTNKTFPFVTVPDFVEKANEVRILADALIIHWAPLVTDENRKEWEEYALTNRHHIDDAYDLDLAYRKQQDKQYGTSSSNANRALQDDNVLDDGTGYHPQIYNLLDGVEPEGAGPYLPAWQRSPINDKKQTMLNFNWAKSKPFSGLLPAIQSESKALLGRTVVPILEDQNPFNQNARISQYRNEIEAFTTDPLAFMAFPVFDRFRLDLDKNRQKFVYNDVIGGVEREPDEDERDIVGVLATNLYWRKYFTNILPPTAVGLICVLENSYNQTFSYRVDGSEATFLGEGDPHDRKYDHLKVSADVNSYVKKRANVQTRSYNAAELNQDFGRYRLHVYPSASTEEVYASHLPKLYTILVAGVFLVAMIVFLLFALMVERRQRIMMERVARSDALVSSLYPEKSINRLCGSKTKPKKKVSWFDAQNDSTNMNNKESKEQQESDEGPQVEKRENSDSEEKSNNSTWSSLRGQQQEQESQPNIIPMDETKAELQTYWVAPSRTQDDALTITSSKE